MSDIMSTLLSTSAQVYSTAIPPAKKVLLYRITNGDTVEEIIPGRIIVGEDLVLNLSSTFSPILNSSTGVAGKALSQLGINSDIVKTVASGTILEGKFKEQSIQIWEKTSPLSFSLTIGLYMETNGEVDVWEPTKTLMKLTAPSDENGFLLPPGPSAMLALSKAGNKIAKNYTGLDVASPEAIEAFYKNNNIPSRYEEYAIQIGNYLFLDSVVITRAEPLVGSASDEKGYPIWTKVRLDLQTTHACTRETIDNFNIAASDMGNVNQNLTDPNSLRTDLAGISNWGTK